MMGVWPVAGNVHFSIFCTLGAQRSFPTTFWLWEDKTVGLTGADLLSLFGE